MWLDGKAALQKLRGTRQVLATLTARVNHSKELRNWKKSLREGNQRLAGHCKQKAPPAVDQDQPEHHLLANTLQPLQPEQGGISHLPQGKRCRSWGLGGWLSSVLIQGSGSEADAWEPAAGAQPFWQHFQGEQSELSGRVCDQSQVSASWSPVKRIQLEGLDGFD